MRNSRRIDALRNLAERPGTEAEGQVAREMLARIESKREPVDQVYAQFGQFLRTGSLDDLAKATGEKTCACGNRYPTFSECPRTWVHTEIDCEMRQRFPRGKRAYYNRWAYSANCPGVVSGYCGGSGNWNWLRVKFDHLKNARAVPVYENGLWHLTTEPVDDATLEATGARGGMENIERIARDIAGKYA